MDNRILVVDDDEATLQSVSRVLTLEGYEVLEASEGESALALTEGQMPDLVVLDVMLPGLDGLTVCRRLREQWPSLPVLMLTARDTVPDRVAGLDSGADDYLSKPFDIDELLARVRALLRRTDQLTGSVIVFEDLSVDLGAREATLGEERLRLTTREFDLLTMFVRHPLQALSRTQLSQQVWGYDFGGESNFVDVAVKELRKKLETSGHPRLIQTVRGFGYALREE